MLDKIEASFQRYIRTREKEGEIGEESRKEKYPQRREEATRERSRSNRSWRVKETNVVA